MAFNTFVGWPKTCVFVNTIFDIIFCQRAEPKKLKKQITCHYFQRNITQLLSLIYFLSSIFNAYSQTAKEMVMNWNPAIRGFKIYTATFQHLVPSYSDLVSSDGPVLHPTSALHSHGCNPVSIFTSNCTPLEHPWSSLWND